MPDLQGFYRHLKISCHAILLLCLHGSSVSEAQAISMKCQSTRNDQYNHINRKGKDHEQSLLFISFDFFCSTRLPQDLQQNHECLSQFFVVRLSKRFTSEQNNDIEFRTLDFFPEVKLVWFLFCFMGTHELGPNTLQVRMWKTALKLITPRHLPRNRKCQRQALTLNLPVSINLYRFEGLLLFHHYSYRFCTISLFI